jgi:aspartate aminotransferase
MESTSHFLSLLSESATLAMTRRSRELSNKGLDIINLSLGEPDFDTPNFIKEAAYKGIENNFTHYMPVNGYADLREAICHKFKRDNNIVYTPEQIVVSTGAKQSLANVILGLVDEGDEVILIAPFWVSYIEQVKMVKAKPVIVQTELEDDFKMTPEQLEKAITKKTKLLILNSPSNPTGSIYTKEELSKLGDVLKKYENVFILSDEIYEHINYGIKHHSLASDPELFNRTITVNGVSKAYAMTGWRIGFLGAPDWIAKACTKIQGQFTSGASSIAQRAALTAVAEDPSCISDMVDVFKSRRDLMLSLLNEIPGIKTYTPGAAFYIYPDISYYYGTSYNEYVINDSNDLCNFLLEVGHVALVPGDAFGTKSHIRLSYATSNDIIIESCKRIKHALTLLK